MINNKKFSNIYIVGVGVYIPEFRIRTSEIANTWHRDISQVSKSLGLIQKSVADSDEDALTMAVSASVMAIEQSKLDKSKIGAIYVGSESHPYAVKPTASMLGEWLNIGHDYYASDLEFACKAGTSGMQIAMAMIDSGMIDYALVVGSDKAQSKPGNALEYAAASASVALIIGKNEGIAKLNATNSFSSDTPDFWRRQGEEFPEHGGRFTGEPAYFRHILESSNTFLSKINKDINDFDHVILHMPNAKFPQKAALKLGVSQQQLQLGFTVKDIGNPYSASAMLGLAKVLLNAEKGAEVLMTSYGSGSGSDNFYLSIEQKSKRKYKKILDKQLENTKYISYTEYLQMMEILNI